MKKEAGMITGAIFDMDGVLLDSMPVWENVGMLFLKECGREAEPGLAEILFTKSLSEAAEYMRVAYQLPDSCKEIVRGITGVVRHQYEAEIPMKPGALEFVRKLKKEGVCVSVATASDRYLAEAGLKRNGILKYVDEIITCNDVGAGKETSPAVYFSARDCMGTETDMTWVFEDAVHGIRTAGRAGFPTVGVYDAASEGSQELLRREATVYLTDLTDFDGFYQLAALP